MGVAVRENNPQIFSICGLFYFFFLVFAFLVA